MAGQLSRDVGPEGDIADARDALPSLDTGRALHADSAHSD